MREKARENLEVAGRLPDEGRADAAANRFYYAAFQAAVHAFEERLGKAPADFRRTATRWRHDVVVANAGLVRDDPADRILLENLLVLRIRADYQTGQVNAADLEAIRRAVVEFVIEATS